MIRYVLVSPQHEKVWVKAPRPGHPRWQEEAGTKPSGTIRLGPAHIYPACQWLQPRADSHGARVLEIDESVLADMFPELGKCKLCADLQARMGSPPEFEPAAVIISRMSVKARAEKLRKLSK